MLGVLLKNKTHFWMSWYRKKKNQSTSKNSIFSLSCVPLFKLIWPQCVGFCLRPLLLHRFYHLNGGAQVCSFDQPLERFHIGSSLAARCYSHNPLQARCHCRHILYLYKIKYSLCGRCKKSISKIVHIAPSLKLCNLLLTISNVLIKN